jgi:hypothetical protein
MKVKRWLNLRTGTIDIIAPALTGGPHREKARNGNFLATVKD